MPAVVVGAASIWGGITAWGVAGSAVAYVAAGAMVVGGAMSVYGGATGNEKLANDGMMIGAVGSLGTMAFGGTASAAAEGAMGSALPGGTSGVAPTAATTTPTTAGGLGGASSVDVATELTKKYADATKSLMEMQQQNTLMQTASGAITGYYQNEAASEQNKLMQDKINYERAQSERRTKNLNPMSPIKVPHIALPNFSGLISGVAPDQRPTNNQTLTNRYTGA